MSGAAVKSLCVDDIRKLDRNRNIDDAVLAVANMEIRFKRNGEPYLFLQLADKTGSIEARHFDSTDMPTQYRTGDPVVVAGTYSQEWGLHITAIQKYSGHIEAGDFLPICPKDIETMYKELLDIMATISNPHLLNLLGAIFLDEQVSEKFRKWPASQEAHHAYIGGLLEHTVSVAKQCQRSAEFYEVDRDLLVAGALLHDIGKLEELDCRLTIAYTEAGSLHKHSLLGSFFVRDRIAAIANFPDKLGHQLLHILESHHRNAEWGAIVEPMTLEAFLVFGVDYMDSKAIRYQALIREQRPLEQSVSSRKDYYLETRVYAPKVEEEP